MIAVRGKHTEAMEGAELAALVAPYDGVTVDLGAGDGRFAYRYATAHPERFVIGIDPVAENLRELSAKAARKLARGGLPNVLYVVASVEQLPPELRGIAGEIFVTLPWGSLMRGIILADPAVLDGIASLARHGAELRIVLNARIFDDPVPADVRDLPEVTPDYAMRDPRPALRQPRHRDPRRPMDGRRRSRRHLHDLGQTPLPSRPAALGADRGRGAATGVMERHRRGTPESGGPWSPTVRAEARSTARHDP